ncbi:surfeit locus protein 1 isoform X2 [Beta vulgaris subsp. vulgaris]|uniref:surfeit locus protein 1 isoform X2 n=1 Tax=Beta vulgaris subsp. vulgaris TaxID=3555 RepID=UPI0009005568|nr:surfeit locus protein 1 isoform X2 [Beta vulgaris subsp. vulgaris]
MAASISKTLTRNLRFIEFLPLSYTSSSPSLPRFFTASSASLLSSSNNPLPNPSPQLQHQGNQRGIWSKLFLFLPGAITFGLGTWQIVRRNDKITLLDYRKERLAMEPIPFNAIAPSENSNTSEFRRVICRGAFDEKRSIFVGPRSRSISGVTENGYYLITPLVPISGNADSVQSPVLVNRGWVPRSWRDKAFQFSQDLEETKTVATSASLTGEKRSFWRFWSKEPQTNEEQPSSVSSVEVVGVIRGSEKPSIFVPENDPAAGQWFFVDVPAIAHASGLPRNTVYIEDINENISPSNPYPVPKDVNTLIRSSVMPQDHLNYTLTWMDPSFSRLVVWGYCWQYCKSVC